jgi:CheY-like chemotaxis protein
MIRILVLANSAVVRAGLQTMLREDGRFDPVDGNFPMMRLQRMDSQKLGRTPDVVLAEIAAKTLSSLSPAPDPAESVPLVLLIDDVTRSELLRAIHIGARAILSRTAEPAEIFAAIEAAFVLWICHFAFPFRGRGVPTPCSSALSTSLRGMRCRAPILIDFSSPRSTRRRIVQSETPHCSATSAKLKDVLSIPLPISPTPFIARD